MTRKTQQLSESGLQVSYLEAGQGTPLVLIHGVGMNADTWFPQMDVLSRYFRVIAVDMPGHGESSGFRHPATLKDYVQWLAQFLQTQPERSFAVAGHSMGALITAGIAIDYPQLVNHAIVMSGVFKRNDSARNAVLKRAQELASGNVRLDAPLDRWFSDEHHEQPLRQKVGTWLQQVNLDGYARAYQAFAAGDRFYSERWNEMQCPVLVMTGELDANSNPDMTRQMAQAARQGQAVVVANAKHMLNLTDADRVNEEILSFLKPVAAAVTQKEQLMDADKRRQLRDAFGAFMTGVTVVTTNDAQGQPIGFTANSFSSVSLDPALLLVSIDKRSANFENFTQCPHFAINILAEQQKETSNIFAQKVADRFSLVKWRKGEFNTPLLDESSAWFECAMHQVIDAGDHAILIGKVEQFDSCGTPGLGYYRGAYFTPYQNAESLIAGPNVVVSALIESAGQALVVKKENGYGLPSQTVNNRSVSETLNLLFTGLNIEANPGFVYSIWEDRQKEQQHIVFLCAQPTGSTLPAVEQGEWVDVHTLAQLPVPDSALKSLVDRFIRENAVGNYGLYYGDEIEGSVRHFFTASHQELV